MVKFFLDTADVDYCQFVWNNFSKNLSGKELVGITTNPNALNKVNVGSLSDMKTFVNNLCRFVSNVRNDDKGVVYVQMPSSKMLEKEVEQYINLIKNFSDGNTKIGLKIPPFCKYLGMVDTWKNEIDFNVTGIADCSTALKCLTYDIRYISIIPGRMEEKSINASEHLNYVSKRKPSKSEVIAGSMRTIEGLRRAIINDTVPTIGWRVLDKIIENHALESVISFWDEPKAKLPHEFSPEVNREMTRLSVDFFQQMDKLGQPIYKEFKNKIYSEQI